MTDKAPLHCREELIFKRGITAFYYTDHSSLHQQGVARQQHYKIAIVMQCTNTVRMNRG
jgi:hypothetical protein